MTGDKRKRLNMQKRDEKNGTRKIDDFFFKSFPKDPLNSAIAFSKKFSLFEKGDKVVVAVSGGKDSVFLLHILSTFKSKFGIREVISAHFNHMTRGEESSRDEKFVISLSEKFGIKVIVGKAGKKLESEEEMRAERYRFLDEVAKSENANKIATAHTLDDQLETFLLNLVRGKGFFSAGGIFPKNSSICSVPVVRPLLSVKSKDIKNYLTKNNLPYIFDSSNIDLSFTRNKIRAFLSMLPDEIYDSMLNGFFKFWLGTMAVYNLLSEIHQKSPDIIPKFLGIQIESFLKGEKLSFEEIKLALSEIEKGRS
ncbi:tRNA(Ile)-lysidine synthase [bacterium HR19]|nr:tRNA(Ile)-lysidine synthase [bacterium HR19]